MALTKLTPAPVTQKLVTDGALPDEIWHRYFQQNDRLMSYILSRLVTEPVGDYNIYDGGHSGTVYDGDVTIFDMGDSDLGND